ncbi:MAG: carbohydrate ABC transporter permease [Spirochaetaceae bacterium]|nr:carbohydrate ABC transporter permease [Spirochaetaceae bacterium]
MADAALGSSSAGRPGRRGVFDIALYAVLLLLVYITAYPFLMIVFSSISDPQEVLRNPLLLFPRSVTLVTYKAVIQYDEVVRGFRNSIVYTVAYTCLLLAVTTTAGYALSRRRFKARRVLLIVFLLPWFFSGGIIPTYIVVKKMGMIDTMWAFIFPGLVSFFYLIMLRTSMEQIAEELIESAVIDGANDVQIFVNVVVPLSKAIIATVALWAAVTQWNNYFGPVLYLTDVKKYPLQVVLRNLIATTQLQEMAETQAAMMETVEDLKRLRARMKTESLKAAVIVISALPILIVYPFIQRYFVKGAMIGAIKG